MSTRKYRRYIRLTDSLFRRETGVNRSTFSKMVLIIKSSRINSRGPSPKLSTEDQVLLLLKYYKDYSSFASVGLGFGVSESVAYRTCILIEKLLISDKDFHLLGKSELLKIQSKQLALDVSESPTQRPSKQKLKRKNRKNQQKQYYSGKKKRHTIKTQIFVDVESKKILSTATEKGRRHDFQLFKKSKTRLDPSNHLLVDSGYQGITQFHSNSSVPNKNSKNNKLTKNEKLENKEISIKRIVVENVFAALKKFKIIAEKYRNRRKRFALRFNLIAAIFNLENS